MWSEKELAELQPRQNLPPCVLPQSIARVQPMVPEVSLFVPSQKSSAQTKDTLKVDTPVRSTELQKSMVFKVNSPTIAYNTLHYSEDSGYGERRESHLSPLRNNSVECHSDKFMELLQKQNEQLIKLQDQVQRLLAIQTEKESSGSNTTDTFNGKRDDNSFGSRPLNFSPMSPTAVDKDLPIIKELPLENCPSLIESQKLEEPNSPSRDLTKGVGSSLEVFDNFTQTSAPTTPHKKQAETNTSMIFSVDHGLTANNDEGCPCWIEKTNDSLIDIPTQSFSTEFLVGSAAQSMVLGESASTYEEEKRIIIEQEGSSRKQFEKILDQVQRLLSPPVSTKNVAELSSDSLNPIKIPLNDLDVQRLDCDDTVVTTINRVKQMGASFLSPDDFKSSLKERNPIDTFYEPKALSRELEPPSSSSTDASLIINTAAMKYLSDEQLGQMAAFRTSSKKQAPNADNSYGLSEKHLSMSTKQFLRHHKLLDESQSPIQQAPKIIDNITSILKQQKLS